MNKKRILALIAGAMAVATATTSLAGCGSDSDGGAEPAQSAASTDTGSKDVSSEATLTIASVSDTGDLNPHSYNSPMWVQSLVYEGLTRFVNGEIIGGIAKSWDISDDGLTYTFHLDPENVFSDGTPVNAEIVKKNFDAVLKVAEIHNWMGTYQVLESAEVVDEYTVQLNLSKPFSGLLQELALSRPVRIGAEAIFPSDGDTSKLTADKIGSGPWKEMEHKEGQYTIFERNDNYHGTKPNYKYLKVLVIPDINTAANSLKAGEIDMIYDIDSQMTGDTYNELSGSGFEAMISDPVTTNMILVNSNSGPTKDVKVRQALCYAINKESISKNIYGGLQPVADYLMNPKTPFCDMPELKVYNYDIDKAGALLDEAGWKDTDGNGYRDKDGQDLTLRFLFEGDNDSVSIMGQVIQAQCKEVGIKVDLVAQDATNYNTSQKEGLFEMLQAETWGDPFDPHSYFSSFRVTTHGDYAAQLGLEKKKEMDAKITEAINATDEKVVEDNYHFVLNYLTEEAVYIPVTYTTKAIIWNKDKVSNASYNTTLDIPYETFRVAE